MGMYTELVLKCKIYDDTPQKVVDVLHYLFNNREDVDCKANLPEHAFFLCPYWSLIGSCSSFYHHPSALSEFISDRTAIGFGYLFSRSDLKNYDEEIELFLDWINPYIEAEPGYCIGWYWYEEEDRPTLIFKQADHE